MKGLMTVPEFLYRVPELSGGQVLYQKGPDTFGGLIETAQVVTKPLWKVVHLATTWQAVHRSRGWFAREDKEVELTVANILDVWVDDADHIILNMKGRVLSHQVKFSLPGGMAMINPAKVRYLKI